MVTHRVKSMQHTGPVLVKHFIHPGWYVPMCVCKHKRL